VQIGVILLNSITDVFPASFSKLHGVFVLTALPITLITGLPTAAFSTSLSSQSYDEIYVFGDSLSDVDKCSMPREFPQAHPTFRTCFQWPVWVEYLANNLGTASTNLAFGGATTGSDNTSIPGMQGLPGLQQQINGLQQLIRPLTRTRLYRVGRCQ